MLELWGRGHIGFGVGLVGIGIGDSICIADRTSDWILTKIVQIYWRTEKVD